MYYISRNAPAQPSAPGAVQPLRFQRCAWCKSPLFGARSLCPHCSGEDLVWEHSSGTGRIADYQYMPRKGNGPRLACRVTMDDGFHVEGRLSGCSMPAPALGTVVRFERFVDGGVPVFTVHLSVAPRR